jgi:hypothetical protein
MPRRRPGRRQLGVRPRLEILEDRSLPSLFGLQTSFATGGSQPASVAVGDFNGDGMPDLAVANYASQNISVLLSNGYGTFKPAANYSVGITHPTSVAVGDFNGDGKPDLAVALAGGSVSVLLGDGDGNFNRLVNTPVAAKLTSVAVGDFNGDGKPDLAVTDDSAGVGTVFVLLGNGDGSFRIAFNSGVGSNPASVAVGDFNGDGKPDLAVANHGSGNVSVLLGNGNGTFQAAPNCPTDSNPVSVAVGDFNGDGKPDLAVADQKVGDLGEVGVLLGNGDGTFQSAGEYAVDPIPLSVAVGDFNGDGKPDLAVACSNSNSVSVLLGNGHGAVQNVGSYSAGSAPAAVAVGDFNGDGKLDLAVANSNGVTVFRNQLVKTTIALEASNRFPVAGQPVTLTATVQSSPLGLGTPTGQVVFQDGGTVLGTASLTFGAATITAPLPTGSQTVTASYSGDLSFLAGSAGTALTVAPFGAPAAISAAGGTPQTAVVGAAFASLLQAKVTDLYGNPVAGAAVTFTAPASGPGGTFSGPATVPTNALGIATAPPLTADASAGSFTVTATVAGIDATVAGVSATVTFALRNIAPPLAVLTPSVAAPVYGQPETLTIALFGAGGTSATGSVDFVVDGKVVQPGVPLASGQATSAPLLLATGSHVVAVNYSGDGNFAAAANLGAQNLTVNPADTSSAASLAVMAAAPASIAVVSGDGQAVLAGTHFPAALVAAVTDRFGDPVAGVTVTFTAPSSGASTTFSSATATTDALGLASLFVQANGKAGVYAVIASYPGVAISAPFVLTNLYASTTTLKANTSRLVFGQSVLLTASVAVPAGANRATGSVTFYDEGDALGTVPLVKGVARLAVPNLDVGTDSYTASYSGNAFDATSASAAVNTTTAQAATGTTLTTSSATPHFGDSVTLTATVSAVKPGAGIPSGSVSFRDGGIVLGTADLVDGVATLSTSALAVGGHALTASYGGDDNFLAGTSAAVSETVVQAEVNVQLSASQTTATAGTPITFSVNVIPANGGTTAPTGTVKLYHGKTVIGTMTLSGATATLTLSNLKSGTHALTAHYGGDTDFLSAISPVLTVTIQ